MQRLSQCAGAEAVAGEELEPHTETVSAYDGRRGQATFPCKCGQFIAHGNVHGGTVLRDAAVKRG